MSTIRNKQALLLCTELFNKCTLEWIETCYSPKLEWIEFSNPAVPQGRHGDYAFFRQFAEKALTLFPDRKLRILKILADDNCVVLEQEWQGTLAVTAENHTAGEIVKLRLASFYTLENGLIIKQVDYCASVV